MNLILRPSTPPIALICSIASFSASTEPVSEIAIVPVTEWRIPTVTSVSVTARPVVLPADVAGVSAHADRGSNERTGSAIAPLSSLRRNGDFRPRLISSDMSTPFVFEDGCCHARIARIVQCTDTQDRVYCTAKRRRRFWHWSCNECSGTGVLEVAGRQRIDRVRRQYNQKETNQTQKKKTHHNTTKSAQRKTTTRVANTALGAISFLALE